MLVTLSVGFGWHFQSLWPVFFYLGSGSSGNQWGSFLLLDTTISPNSFFFCGSRSSPPRFREHQAIFPLMIQVSGLCTRVFQNAAKMCWSLVAEPSYCVCPLWAMLLGRTWTLLGMGILFNECGGSAGSTQGGISLEGWVTWGMFRWGGVCSPQLSRLLKPESFRSKARSCALYLYIQHIQVILKPIFFFLL